MMSGSTSSGVGSELSSLAVLERNSATNIKWKNHTISFHLEVPLSSVNMDSTATEKAAAKSFLLVGLLLQITH